MSDPFPSPPRVQRCIVQKAGFWNPGRREVEIMNATDRTVTIGLVPSIPSMGQQWNSPAIDLLGLTLGVPTAIESLRSMLALIGAAGVALRTEMPQFQVLRVPAKAAPGPPQDGERLPFARCDFPQESAKMVVVTVDKGTAFLWYTRNLPERTRVVTILPAMFSGPALEHRNIGEDKNSLAGLFDSAQRPSGPRE